MRLHDLPGRILRRLLFGKKAKILSERKDLAGYEIGRWSYGDLEVFAWSKNGKLKIGNFCSFAAHTTILLGGEHRIDLVTTFPIGVFLGGTARDAHEKTKGDVVIGNDVWVGQEATILSGVTIGDGAVVGAKSLVTADVPPYAIVAGNPASLIRMRFDEDTVRRMLEVRWWEWSDERIIKEAGNLLGENIISFVERNVGSSGGDR
jgi:acetyltransferase-like isoleucine patch superfamily enzyme